jgi:hypothetical protein
MAKGRVECIWTKQIDSFQKLRVLLFLYQNPRVREDYETLAQRLYIGDVKLLKKILSELERAGLVDCSEDYCTILNKAEVKACLRCLAGAFEDPLIRQILLDEVRQNHGLTRGQTGLDCYDYDCTKCVLVLTDKEWLPLSPLKPLPSKTYKE